MEREELYKYLKTLNPHDFKEVDVANPASFLRSIRDRLVKAKNVYNSIKTFIKQKWTAIQYSDNEVILVGMYDETLIAIYVKIIFVRAVKQYETEQVIIEQRSIRHEVTK